VTEKNKRVNLKEDLERSKEAMQAYSVLLRSGLCKDAMSRMYYALLHQIRALLLTKGLEPETHDGALTLLSLHFVKEKIIAHTDAHLFARLMKYREEADYTSSYVFTEQDCADLQREVDGLSKRIIQYLVDNKYLS